MRARAHTRPIRSSRKRIRVGATGMAWEARLGTGDDTVAGTVAGSDSVPGGLGDARLATCCGGLAQASGSALSHGRSEPTAVRYRLDSEIGRGATAVVYRGRDLLLDREVAAKAFTALSPTAEEARMQRAEAGLLARMSHPGVVTLLDVGVDVSDAAAHRFVIVMELIEGPDLRSRLRAGALDLVQVARLGADLCSALEYVHDRGVLHRDVKPANVLLASSPGSPSLRAKLADFGIALPNFGAGSRTFSTAGTAAYLSPEQVEGKTLSPATDVYSLGLVLLEALTAKVAFGGSAVEAALARLERDPAVPERAEGRLGEVLSAMTSRYPDRRPTAAAARSAFRAVIADRTRGAGLLLGTR
jgi:eukaryotic-like serine/threonine-protein kinase